MAADAAEVVAGKLPEVLSHVSLRLRWRLQLHAITACTVFCI